MTERLTEFTVSVITVCVAAGILTALSPEGKTKRYFKLLVSLCLLAAILSPLLSVFTDYEMISEELGEIIEDISGADTENENEMRSDIHKKAVEKAICELVCKEFGLNEGEIEVGITLDTGNLNAVEVKKIDITLKRGNAEAIYGYVNEMFKGTAVITIEEGG